MATKKPAPSEVAYAAPSSPIAEIFERWTLDLVIDLVLAVANDFIQRPRHYRQVPANVADILSEFKSIGSAPDMPNGKHRAAIYGALLGRVGVAELDGVVAVRLLCAHLGDDTRTRSDDGHPDVGAAFGEDLGHPFLAS